MPDLSSYDSWPAVAALALVLLGFQVPSLVSTIRTHRDTKAIRTHTENEHADADYPNLRDELTATRVAAEAAASAAQDAVTIAKTTDTRLTDHITQADAWQTSVEDDLTRLRRPLLAWRR
ncbi:hypothetical protein ACFS27_03430 [Promicromonospora vindobonensis]|uniref:Minor tail protein n=1 Tax=Promicromonospora vindobonensis TaxID=195748 RepID=A0ABW5VQT6_9MICO